MPSAAFFSDGLSLVLSARCSVAGVTVRMNFHRFSASGLPLVAQLTLSPTSDRAESTATVAVAACELLQVTVEISAGSVRRGQCYVQVFTQHDTGASAVITARLIGGYLEDGNRLTWPIDTPQHSLSGRGALRSITGTNPDAGVEISETVPTNARWIVHGVRARLVTDSTVANRVPRFVFTDGTSALINQEVPAAQTASQTRDYNVTGSGTAQAVVNSNVLVPLPLRVPMLQGWQIVTATANLQAGDNWGAPVLFIEELIEE